MRRKTAHVIPLLTRVKFKSWTGLQCVTFIFASFSLLRQQVPKEHQCQIPRTEPSCHPFLLAERAFLPWRTKGISQSLYREVVYKDRKGVAIRILGSSVNVFATRKFIRKGKPANVMHALRALDLVSRVHARAKLPDMEFFLHYEDRPVFLLSKLSKVHAQPLPIFSLVTSPRHADILFPNVVRPSVDGENRYIGLRSPPHVPWNQKASVLFWRGGAHFVDSPEHSRAKLACHSRSSDIYVKGDVDLLDVGFHDPPERLVDKNFLQHCTRPFVPFNQSGNYKYLAILDGNGYTERFKIYTSLNSLLIWWPGGRGDEYEHFHAGFKNGTNILIVKSLQALLWAVRYARKHDAEMKKMAERMNRFSDWMFHADTTDCYLYLLLTEYAKTFRGDALSARNETLYSTTQFDHLEEIMVPKPSKFLKATFKRRCAEVRRARPT